MKEKIILWGCGNCGEYAYELLKEQEETKEIVGFGDNDLSKVGTCFKGKPVLSVEEINQKYPDALIMITIMKVDNEIIKQELEQKGIKNRICSFKDEKSVGGVEDRRKECSSFHINCMDDYFEEAEEKNSLDVFWSEDSPFRQQFDKLDVTSVVELACGRGRHVPQYMDKSEKIVLVDILDKNIEYCKERFFGISKIQYYVNSGCDLKDLEDETYTAIFSYDAMVHFEAIDVYYYLLETSRILKTGGMALYHHSKNDSDYKASFLRSKGGRNFMSMNLFAHFADRAGLEVVSQTDIQWGEEIVDGLTLLRKK